MIPIELWLETSVGLDLVKYQVLLQKFHEANLFTIEDLYQTSHEKITNIIHDCDLIMEEWEALAFFSALDKLESQIVPFWLDKTDPILLPEDSEITLMWTTSEGFLRHLDELFLQKTTKIEITRTMLVIFLRRMILFVQSNILYQIKLLTPSPDPIFALLELMKKIAFLSHHPSHLIVFQNCFEFIIVMIHNHSNNQLLFAKQGMLEWTIHFLHHYHEYPVKIVAIACQTLENFLCHLDNKYFFQKLNLQGNLLQLLDEYSHDDSVELVGEEEEEGGEEEKEKGKKKINQTILECLFTCVSHLLDSPFVTQIITSTTSSSFITSFNIQSEMLSSVSSVKQGDNESIDGASQTTNDVYNSLYHAKLFSTVENTTFFYSIMKKYYETNLIIAEISLEIIQKLALHHPKIRESLFLKTNNPNANLVNGIQATKSGSNGGVIDFPEIVSQIAKFHGPYHANIAELSIHTIAILSQSHQYLSTSAIGGISGVNLIIHTLEKQELNHPLTAYYSLLALFNILQAEKEIILRKATNLFYALDYSKQIIKYIISMIYQHVLIDPTIAVIGLNFFHLLADRDTDTWHYIAIQEKGIQLIIYLLEQLFNHSKHRIASQAIEKSLEILLWFIQTKTILQISGGETQIEKLFSLTLILNLLEYHGKSSSLALFQFIVHTFNILYPSRPMKEIHQPQQRNTATGNNVIGNREDDERICEIFISLYLYYFEKEEQNRMANQLFSISEDGIDGDEQSIAKRLNSSSRSLSSSPHTIERKGISNKPWITSSTSATELTSSIATTTPSYKLTITDDYLAILSCLDALILITNFPPNQSYFFTHNIHTLLLQHLQLKQQFYQQKNLHTILSHLPVLQREQYYLFYQKMFLILKNFILIQKNQKKLIKDGLIKLMTIFLQLFGTESIELTQCLLEMICTLAIHHKLVLAEMGICEWVVKLIVFYNNFLEELHQHDLQQQQQTDFQFSRSGISNTTTGGGVVYHNEIAQIGSNCIVNLTIHSKENRIRFLSLKEFSFSDYGIHIQDFDLILYLQLLLQHSQITNHTKLEIKEAINVLKFA